MSSWTWQLIIFDILYWLEINHRFYSHSKEDYRWAWIPEGKNHWGWLEVLPTSHPAIEWHSLPLGTFLKHFSTGIGNMDINRDLRESNFTGAMSEDPTAKTTGKFQLFLIFCFFCSFLSCLFFSFSLPFVLFFFFFWSWSSFFFFLFNTQLLI